MTLAPRARRTRPPRALAAALFAWVLLLAGALLAAGVLLAAGAGPAAAAEQSEPLPIDGWLALGPVAAPLPAFHDAARATAPPPPTCSTASGLVGQAPWPAAGDTVTLPEGATAAWRVAAAEGGALGLSAGSADAPRRAWLAVRLDVSRFVEPKLTVASAHPLRVWLDGEQVAEKGSDAAPGDADDSEPGKAEGSLSLPPGPHLLMVQTVFDPGLAGSPWTVTAALSAAESDAGDDEGGDPTEAETGAGTGSGGRAHRRRRSPTR